MVGDLNNLQMASLSSASTQQNIVRGILYSNNDNGAESNLKAGFINFARVLLAITNTPPAKEAESQKQWVQENIKKVFEAVGRPNRIYTVNLQNESEANGELFGTIKVQVEEQKEDAPELLFSFDIVVRPRHGLVENLVPGDFAAVNIAIQRLEKNFIAHSIKSNTAFQTILNDALSITGKPLTIVQHIMHDLYLTPMRDDDSRVKTLEKIEKLTLSKRIQSTQSNHFVDAIIKNIILKTSWDDHASAFAILKALPNQKDYKEAVAEALSQRQVTSYIVSLAADENRNLDAFRQLVEALKSEQATLESLELALYSGLGQHVRDYISVLSEALEHIKSLKKLNLNAQFIDKHGERNSYTIGLAKGLIKNKTLTYLNLSSNNINETGAQALAQALMTNRTLQTLELSGDNYLSSLGIKALANALKVNDSLLTLALESTRMGDDDVTNIAEALRHNTSLRKLNLTRNKGITLVGAKSLALALEQNSNSKIQSIVLDRPQDVAQDGLDEVATRSNHRITWAER